VVLCAVEGCTNPRRNAQAAKYCDVHATSVNYELQTMSPRVKHGVCLVCRVDVAQRTGTGTRLPLFVCQDHQHLRDTLSNWRNKYHLADDRIAQLLDDPRCWICHASLRWRFTNWGGEPQAGRGQVHVDHDHRCCPGERSCGQCVRGLAHHACNRRLGPIEAMIKDLGVDGAHRLIDELGSPTLRA
jgi:hypothetical protein